MSVYLGNQRVSPSILAVQPILQPIVMRPDAEKIQTYSIDRLAVTDDELELPSEFSTTATTLIASQALTPTLSLDFNNYDYFIAQRTLTIPIYNIETTAEGREEYQITVYCAEIIEQPGNLYTTIDGTKAITGKGAYLFSRSSVSKEIYWTSATALGTYTFGTVYCVAQNYEDHSVNINTDVLTIKSPNLIIRGHNTYFTKTFYEALTDIRYQYIIEVWRAPKNNLNIDGWNADYQFKTTLENAKNNNWKLS